MAGPAPKVGDIALVTWSDHMFYQGEWDENEPPYDTDREGLMLFQSVGFVLAVSPKALSLAQSVDADDAAEAPHEVLVLDRRTVEKYETL